MVVVVPASQPGRRRARVLTALALCCLVLSVPGWAWAEAAPLPGTPLPSKDDPVPADTVTKTIEDVLAPVRETAQPVTKTVGDAAKPVTDTVPEVTEPVRDLTEPVAEVVDPVTDVVNPEPQRPDPRPPTGRDPTTGPSTTLDADSLPPPQRMSQPTAATPHRPTLSRDSTTRRRPQTTLPGALRNDVVAPTADLRLTGAATAATIEGSALDEVRQAVVEASRAFRFPLLLAAAVLLFLALQGRLDARDPKLAQTAPEQELTFA